MKVDAATGSGWRVVSLDPATSSTPIPAPRSRRSNSPTGPSFVNDVVVTGDAAWFTDSFRAVIYRVDLGDGEISEMELTE